ncbi:MAG: hypothetical protein NC548_35830 [Lachnospiraceae bacterium]|nr:hypothetical protein [Lachnospiraceae bacterium]
MAYAAFILVLLSAVGFFNYHNLVSETVTKLLFLTAVTGAAAVAWIQQRKTNERLDYPRTAWLMIMCGVAVSILMVSYYHPQSIFVSIVTTLPILFAFFTFWIYVKFNFPIENTIKVFMGLAAISSIVFFCNTLTLPNNMFGKPMLDLDESRGIIRVVLPFAELFPVLIFYVINRWLEDKNAKWIFLGSFLLLMVVLTVTRQLILYTLLLSAIFILRKTSWKIKALICAGAVAIVAFVLPMIPIYNTMMELSEDQIDKSETEEEDVRIQAWRFYTYENQTGMLTPILGNGIPAQNKSIWGIAFDAETDERGLFYVDVGWAGFYWLYGAVALIGLIWLMVAALVREKPENMQFLNYSVVFYMLLPIASGPICYFFQITVLMAVFSMAFTCKADEPAACELEEKETESYKSLLPRFPQLR